MQILYAAISNSILTHLFGSIKILFYKNFDEAKSYPNQTYKSKRLNLLKTDSECQVPDYVKKIYRNLVNMYSHPS